MAIKAVNRKTISITVDVETDWGGRMPPSLQGCQGIKFGIPIILEVLAKYNTKATFFISGEIVKNSKTEILAIHANGHEIASHGFTHHLDYCKLSPVGLAKELRHSKSILEDLIGEQVLGFRAPQFRINERLPVVLMQCGYKYDSSMVKGCLAGRYSNLKIPNKPFLCDGILEIPITSLIMNIIPMGLLWMNALGFPAFNLLSRRSDRTPHLVSYLHPFDLAPRIQRGHFGFRVNFWYLFKRGTVEKTFSKLIKKYSNTKRHFVCLRDLLG